MNKALCLLRGAAALGSGKKKRVDKGKAVRLEKGEK